MNNKFVDAGVSWLDFDDEEQEAIEKAPKPRRPAAAFEATFDFVSPRMVAAAETMTADLVTAVAEETRAAIRAVLGRSFAEGIPTRDVGRLIRPLIGLTERDAVAVTNMWARLTNEGRAEEQVDRMTERYSDQLLNRRAENIARTETIRAASLGQEETWLQAAEQGLINPAETKRRWLAAENTEESDRTCPICEGLDGQEVGMDEPFEFEGEEYGGPPDPHPSCRCSLGLVFEAPKGLVKYSEDQPRDESGRWTSGGGTGEEAPSDGLATSPPPGSVTWTPSEKALSKPYHYENYTPSELREAAGPVVYVPIDSAKPTENWKSPGRRSGAEDEKRVAGIVEHFRAGGQEVGPVLLDSKLNILDGHHRFEAARRAGISHIPAQILPKSFLEKFDQESSTPLRRRRRNPPRYAGELSPGAAAIGKFLEARRGRPGG